MSDLGKLNERIAALEAAATQLREDTAEARATIKDLKAVEKQVRDLLGADVRKIVDEAIDDAVAKGLAGYADTITAAQEAAVDRVNASFEELAHIYLHGDKKGEATLHELAMAKKARSDR